MPREPFDLHRHDRDHLRRHGHDRYENEDPVQRVADNGGEHRSWRDRRHDDHEHDAGGTYGFRDQSEASRRSAMRTDQRYQDSGMGSGRSRNDAERDYGRSESRYSGYGSSGQGQYGRGGYPQGGYGQGGAGDDYGQRDLTRTDAAQGLHPDHDLDPDYLDWRHGQLSAYDRDYAHWRQERQKEHDEEYRNWRNQRRSSFHQSFSNWRSGQSGLSTGVNTRAMEPGLSANEAQISHSSGPGPTDGEFDADPRIVGAQNSGESTGALDASERQGMAGGSGSQSTTGSLGMSPEANPSLANIAGGNAGRSRDKDKDEDR